MFRVGRWRRRDGAGVRATCQVAHRGALVGALATLAVLASAANALAVSGTPIDVGTPFESGPPAVAVDSAGTAYIAWANTKDLAPVTTNIVQYCVLPAGAKACSYTGSLAPADNGGYIDGVQVLVDGSTIVLLADVYGTSGSSSGDYIPEQEWQSTNGGASFSIVNGGRSVADGILNADTGPLSAVIVPGTNVLGYGWNTAGGPPTFNEFPLTSPSECSTVLCNGVAVTTGSPPYPFAALEPETNPDTISNAGGQFASALGSNAGVLAIFNTDFSNGPLACAPGDGTAYAYASGEQSPSNNYNISPGSPGSAWRVPITQADCNVGYPAVGAGPSGFGVLEGNTADNDIVYHRFDQTHQDFDTPLVTIAADKAELDPAVSQDGAGGVYATFLLGGAGGPISLAYSSNGGATWSGPATLDANTDGGANSMTSSVGPSGQGWAVWNDNGSVYAQQFVAADASPAVASVEGGASSSGSTVTIKVKCPSSEPCAVTVTITATEVTIVYKASVARKKIVRKRVITLATGTFAIPGKGSKKLLLHLTKAGKRLLTSDHGHLKANIRIANKTAAGVGLTTGTIAITTVKPKGKK